jgi:hypothetical protein
VFDFLPQTKLADPEFKAIANQIGVQVRSLLARRPAPRILHHYTDALGLKGIVESGAVRATHIAYMNDASEYLHAVNLLLDQIREAKKIRTNKDQLALLEHIYAPVADTKPEHVPPYFVACFSEKENSLNQWRAYGRGEGGYSIGFSTEFLMKALARHGAILAPALYDRDEQAKLTRSVLEWALDEYPKIAEKQDAETKAAHLENWAHHLLWFAGGLAPIMKNPAFEEENEWRVIYLLKTKREAQFIPKPKGLVPVVAMKLGEPQPFIPLSQELPNDVLTSQPDRLPIVSLWCGPGSASGISLLSGRTLLESTDIMPSTYRHHKFHFVFPSNRRVG